MSLKETAYGLGLRGLGFRRVVDETLFQFEMNGILVKPMGRAYIRVSSPDHLTVVQDENGYLYRTTELVPTHHLAGKDVTEFVTNGAHKETRRLKGRAYVPALTSPVRIRNSHSLCSTRIRRRRVCAVPPTQL